MSLYSNLFLLSACDSLALLGCPAPRNYSLSRVSPEFVTLGIQVSRSAQPPHSPPPFSFHSLLRSLFSFPVAVMPSDLQEAVFDLACSLLPVRLTPSSPVSPPRRIPFPSRLALRHRTLAASILVGGRGELPCLLARVIITVIANARRRQPHMTPF